MAGKPIIVGVDGTPESLRAVELATMIASAARARLLPVHAVPAIPPFTGVAGIEPMPSFSPELQEELVNASRKRIERALDQFPTAAELEVQTGPAPHVIAEAARQQHAELVVLGGKRHGALARGLGRSTAHHLVRKLDVPILVVGDSVGPITKVLAVVDLSSASLPTVKAAERLAHLFDARLRLLYVVEPFRYTDLAPDLWDAEGYRHRLEEAFEKFASQFASVAKEDRVVRHAEATDGIIAEVGAWHPDVVVAGSHGKGWVDRILVGSTTQRLVTELPASLLVVPTGRTPVSSLETASARARNRSATPGRRPTPKRSRAPRGK